MDVRCIMGQKIITHMNGFFQKLLEQSKGLQNHAAHADEIQLKSIAEFQKAYEVC